jgi:surface polysaccharide O-acyltransferase-like enzyme
MSEQQGLLTHSPWVDACRLFSIFGVLIIHIAGPIVNEYRSITLDQFLAANAIESFARVSVPLFTMLSGSLLLGKSASLSNTGRRIFRTALPLIFWSFIYVFWIGSWSGKPLDPLDAVSLMLQSPVMYHLWFVYMIIGVYLLLPILRLISDALISDQNSAIYLLVLWFVVNSITIYYPIKLIQQLNLSNFFGWPGYFILGYYLTRSEWLLSISHRLNAWVFFLANLCTFGLNWRFNAMSLTPVITAYDYFSPFVIIASVAAFLWFKQLKVPDFFVKPFVLLSSVTFPIYFMHIIVIGILTGKNHGFAMTPYYIHPVIGILGLTILTFFASSLLALCVRFIPFSSKVIG